MDLAKYQLDTGLATGNRDAMLAFWQQEVGLVYEGPLSVGKGVQQHRHQWRGSVIKINHARDGVPDTPATGIRRLLLAQPDWNKRRDLADPDGNQVSLLPPGEQGITQLGVVLAVRDLAAHRRFWGEVMQLPAAPASGADAFRCGDSVILLEEDAKATVDPGMTGRGFRYLTMQVWDADSAMAGVLKRGGRLGREAHTHGQVARYGFVRDPDGNWIELSQRASLVGPVA